MLTTHRLSSLKAAEGATWPEHIIDVKRAIAWVKHNIRAYGGDPDRIFIAGGSAGGHLAALAALTPSFPEFQPGFENEDTSVTVCLMPYIHSTSIFDICVLYKQITSQACAAIYGVFDFVDSKGQWVEWDRYNGKRHPDPTKPAIIVKFLQKYIFKRQFEEHRHVYERASPVHHAHHSGGKHVQFLVVHGDRDILVPVI